MGPGSNSSPFMGKYPAKPGMGLGQQLFPIHGEVPGGAGGWGWAAHNPGAMRRILRLALAILLPLVLLTACGFPGQNAVTYTAYYLTCCTKADIDQTWQPGTTVELHWILESASRTTVNPTHKTVLTAVLTGPYKDASTLKEASGATHTVQGSITTMDDRNPPPVTPVATFLLPPDLPPGYYNLKIKWDFGDGSSAASASIVQVGPQ